MSATRFRKPVAIPAGTGAADRVDVQSRWRPRLLVAAGMLATAWSAALLVMDVWTSNPRLVSRDQVALSDVVIIGRISRPGNDLVKVERVFHGDVEEGDELRVRNLGDLPGTADGQSWVMPLSAFRDDYVVTTLDGQKSAPLVYAPSPGIVDQVKAILRDRL